MRQSGESLPPAWGTKMGTLVTEREEEFAGAPTDLQVKTSASFATLPATAPPATALLVTARHATATQATRGGAASAATLASRRWTATDCQAAQCSHPRMKRKTRAPLSLYPIPATCRRTKRRVGQEERGGWGDGRRPVGGSRGSQPWPGPLVR